MKKPLGYRNIFMKMGFFCMLSLISPAYAQGGMPSSADFLSFLPLLAVLLVLYFFFFRTQQKKEKQHKELILGLRKGDRVLTNGGLIGTVAKVGTEQEILLEIAEGVRVRFLKTMIASVLGKGEILKDTPGMDEQDSKEKIFAPKEKAFKAKRLPGKTKSSSTSA